MCEEFEWLAWQHEVERRTQESDKVKKQRAAEAPVTSAQPDKEQEEPVPA